MMFILYGPALLLGAVLTMQVATNKQLGEALHNPYVPAVSNMVIGLVAALAVTIVLTEEWPTATMIRATPWYLWLAGGCFGVVYLTATILLAPRIGAATLIALVVTGQIASSVLIDHFGWFGFERHAASPPRLLGCLLLAGGVALVSKF